MHPHGDVETAPAVAVTESNRPVRRSREIEIRVGIEHAGGREKSSGAQQLGINVLQSRRVLRSGTSSYGPSADDREIQPLAGTEHIMIGEAAGKRFELCLRVTELYESSGCEGCRQGARLRHIDDHHDPLPAGPFGKT